MSLKTPATLHYFHIKMVNQCNEHIRAVTGTQQKVVAIITSGND